MKRLFTVLALCLGMLSCGPTGAVARIDLLAFSTTASFSVYAPPANLHNEVVPALEQRMALLESRWRSFGDGNLATLNQTLEAGGCARTDPATFELVRTALHYQQLSDGLFDPTLGFDVDAWGFRDTDQVTAEPAPPVKGILTIEGDALCSNAPLRLDLGGIAKGAIVQDLARLLEQFDIRNAIINIGGDLLVLGQRGRTPWRVAIQHPRAPRVIAYIDAADGEAIFSSGDYQRRRIINDNVAHHILDPRTGAPSTGAIATTVIHSNPLLADAAATALLVAGAGEFASIADKLGVTRAILIDGELNVHSLEGTNVHLPPTLSDPP